MHISEQVRLALKKSSAIRSMFEAGNRLKAEHGEDKVYDFSLGNPCFDPPPEVNTALRDLVRDPPPRLHSYMPNAGHLSTRTHIAAYLTVRDKHEVTASHIVMSNGAGGGLNVLFKAILNPGDEVITIAPFFVEYMPWVNNYGGKLVACPSNQDFSIDFSALESAFTSRTKAVLLNSPNNPTGVVYPVQDLQRVADIMTQQQRKYGGKVIYLISDEPYRRLTYDGVECASITDLYPNSIIVTSFSKDLALAGERIGYIYISPRLAVPELFDCLVFTTRVLGFVNAPAMMQRIVARVIASPIDMQSLTDKRAMMAEILTAAGLQFTMPQGAFYFFPAVPGGNDEQFCQFIQENYHVLTVAGRNFGRPGHFRLSYSVTDKIITNSRAAWCAGVKAWKSKRRSS